MVYVRLMGGVVLVVIMHVAVLLFIVFVFLGPWLSASKMNVLLFGSGSAAFIILFVMPLTISIHSP